MQFLKIIFVLLLCIPTFILVLMLLGDLQNRVFKKKNRKIVRRR